MDRQVSEGNDFSPFYVFVPMFECSGKARSRLADNGQLLKVGTPDEVVVYKGVLVDAL